MRFLRPHTQNHLPPPMCIYYTSTTSCSVVCRTPNLVFKRFNAFPNGSLVILTARMLDNVISSDTARYLSHIWKSYGYNFVAPHIPGPSYPLSSSEKKSGLLIVALEVRFILVRAVEPSHAC